MELFKAQMGLIILKSVFNSWWSRARAMPAIKSSANNEEPAGEHLKMLEWVNELCESGVFRKNGRKALGASSDWEARITADGMDDPEDTCA